MPDTPSLVIKFGNMYTFWAILFPLNYHRILFSLVLCLVTGITMGKNKTNGIIRVTGFALVLLYIILLQEVTIRLTSAADLQTRALASTAVFFGSFLLMYLAILGFIKWEGHSDVTELGIKWDSETHIHLVIGAIAGIGAALAVYLVALVFGGSLTPIESINADLIISEIVITAPVAFFEELCYRGYLMTRIESVSNRGAALILSSLWFGLLHFGWWFPFGTIPPHLILTFTASMVLGGIVLGISYYLSGRRLWVAIAFHFAWNMLAYILFPVYPREPAVLPEIFQIEWGITTLPAMLFGLSLIWILLDIFKKKEMKGSG
ncbi:MAG: CPBP family intramembrane metalloprotease [Candidatus Thorarchaeota archaeon]|nr:CPBP family intramembrane metalloprotease [Candidatus Thorarchaeota archaeon]